MLLKDFFRLDPAPGHKPRPDTREYAYCMFAGWGDPGASGRPRDRRGVLRVADRTPAVEDTTWPSAHVAPWRRRKALRRLGRPGLPAL